MGLEDRRLQIEDIDVIGGTQIQELAFLIVQQKLVQPGVRVNLRRVADRALDREGETGGMRKRAGEALRGDGETSRGCIRKSAEDHGSIHAFGFGEGTGGVGYDAAGQAAERYLDGACEAVLWIDQHVDRGTGATLGDGEGVGGEGDGEILRTWSWSDLRLASATSASVGEEKNKN